MTKVYTILAAAALTFLPSLANAEAAAPVSFIYGGQTYTYTVEQDGSKQVLRGVVGKSKEPFVLNVGKHWVDGTVDGRPVSFSLKSVKRIKGIVTVEENLAMR
jgi:hypothetical protein